MNQSQIDEAALGMCYGESGSGKSTDLIYSCPRFLFIAMPGGLLPADTVCGYHPSRIVTARTFDDLIAIVKQEAQKQDPKDKSRRLWDGMVVDDFSLMSDTTISVKEQNFPTTRSGDRDTNAFWGGVRRNLIDVRETFVTAGMHLIVNAHIRPPHTDQRKGFVPGGPMLPGTMPADMPKTFSFVFRVMYAEGLPVWPFVYHVEEDVSTWVWKNRYGLYGDLPMNIGEMLRLFYGVDGPLGIRRLAAIPWQEEMVEKIATKLYGIPIQEEAHAQLRAAFKTSLIKRYPDADLRHIAWTIRDGMHRALFRELRSRSILDRY